MKKLSFFLFLFCNVMTYSRGTETFTIEVYANKVRVISPSRYKSPLSVIIENKSLLSLRGKFIEKSGRVLSFANIPAKGTESVPLNFVKNSPVFFVPVSPPFQKIVLTFGKEVYEIPSKK